jgi:hypothetical protein
VSTAFYITPFDPKAWENPNDTNPKPTSDLHIEPAVYREKLKERWNEIVFFTSSPFPLEWELPPESNQYSGLSGQLENHQIVSFGTGPKKSFLDFILWHRSFVPEQYQLFLFHSSAWFDSLILTMKTTEQDIINFTGIVS